MSTGGLLAVQFVAKEQAELRELELDSRPLGPHEIAGRTLASLVSKGTELAVYQGHHAATRFPCGAGYAAVFEVDAVGSEVKAFAPGDRAFGMKPHQSRQRCLDSDAVPVPADLPSERAAWARIVGVSMTTLVTTAARPPDTVLVTGLGPVGNTAAQVFSACGYRVVTCDPAESRRRLARAVGIVDVRERVPRDDTALVGKVALVVECSGHEQAVVDACHVVRRRGEVVLVGVPWARLTNLTAHDLLYPVFHRYVVLRSGWEWELPTHEADFRPASIFANFTAALGWLAEGRLTVDGLSDAMSPRSPQDAYQRLLRGETDRLTVVFDWSALGK